MICPFIVFWDAEFVTSIEIRVAEAAREAVEATWRLEFGLYAEAAFDLGHSMSDHPLLVGTISDFDETW